MRRRPPDPKRRLSREDEAMFDIQEVAPTIVPPAPPEELPDDVRKMLEAAYT